MSNTPTLMQSEERRLNELNSEPKKIKVDITVSITMSKTTTIDTYSNSLGLRFIPSRIIVSKPIQIARFNN